MGLKTHFYFHSTLLSKLHLEDPLLCGDSYVSKAFFLPHLQELEIRALSHSASQRKVVWTDLSDDLRIVFSPLEEILIRTLLLSHLTSAERPHLLGILLLNC